MSRNVLLISPEILKDRTAIHTNIDEKLIFPTVKICQDMFIHPILGTALYNKIITEVEAASITGDYKNLLDDYIIDALCYYTVSKLPLALSYQFWNKGVVRKQGDSTELPTPEEMETIRNEYRNIAEWYGERLSKYLIENASSTVLPEYLEGNDTIDTINPSSTAFTSPIYLGSMHDCQSLDKNNCNCED
jgi:uncharacterized protein YeeX (DUF496 family)